MTTLLEKAMAMQPRKKRNIKFTREHLDVTLAYLDNNITLRQVQEAFSDTSSSNSTYKMLNILKEAYNNGVILIELK